MTAYMPAPWPPQHSQMHPMGTYQDHEAMGHWSMPMSLPPQQQMQHPTHLPMMHHMPPSQQPPLRPQSSQSSLSALPSPVHSVPHSQGMVHPHQHLPQQLSLPPLGQSLPLPHPSPQQQPQRYSQPVPHQVVGQQGIRGVLPVKEGISKSQSPDETCEPEQEEDGTWPCKYCGKKYRHAKHLRRHHARHTGDTPYECSLCHRRFGRSDVLKRHYHKCATRRGVEVGDHLQGQRGHPRRRGRGAGDLEGTSPGSSVAHEVKPPVTPGSMPMDQINPAWGA